MRNCDAFSRWYPLQPLDDGDGGNGGCGTIETGSSVLKGVELRELIKLLFSKYFECRCLSLRITNIFQFDVHWDFQKTPEKML